VIDPDEREGEVAGLLADWPMDRAGVLIGGYAVAAYGLPRYSIDVDIVIPAEEEGAWTQWLRLHDLRLQRAHQAFPRVGIPLAARRWRRGSVVLDLMIGGVRDRDSGAVIPEEWISRDARSIRLELLSGRIDHDVRVVRLEALWALKILAGRPQDLTDLFGISGQPVRLGEVRELLAGILDERLRQKLGTVSKEIHQGKLYTDSLSSLRLGSPELERNQSAWSRYAKLVDSAIPLGTGAAHAT
jgi:hypothetical protein